MKPECEEIQALMSGLVDGELSRDDRQRVHDHVDSCAECGSELDSLQMLVNAASSLAVKLPADEVWDTFLENVYNRLERRTGWIFVVAGVVVLSAFVGYHYIADPWSSPMTKVLVAVPAVGLAVLLISVLRQRLKVAPIDRYSRDVKR